MVFSTRLVIWALSTIFLGVASAATPEGSHAKEALALLEAGGDADFFASVHDVAADIQEPVASRLGDESSAKLKKRLDREATSSIFRSGYLAAYEKHRDEKHRQANLAFFTTPLFKKIRAAEDQSETEAGERKMTEFMKTLDPASVSEERQEAINTIASEAGTLDIVLGMLDTALDLQLRAANAVLPAGDDLDDREIRQQVDAAREARANQMEVLVIGDLLFTYRDLSDAELDRYADFCASPSGQWYAQILVEGLYEGARKAARVLSPGSVPKSHAPREQRDAGQDI